MISSLPYLGIEQLIVEGRFGDAYRQLVSERRQLELMSPTRTGC